MYKKILSLILVTSLCISMTGCNKNESLPVAGNSVDNDSNITEDTKYEEDKRAKLKVFNDMKASGIFSPGLFVELPDYETIKKDLESAGIIAEYEFGSESGTEDYYDAESSESFKDSIPKVGVYGGIKDKGYIEITKIEPYDYDVYSLQGMAYIIEDDCYDLAELDESDYFEDDDDPLRQYPYSMKAGFNTEECAYYAEIKGLSPVVEAEVDEDTGESYVDFVFDDLKKDSNATLCHLKVYSGYGTIEVYAAKDSIDKFIKVIQKWGMYKTPVKDLMDINCDRDVYIFTTNDDMDEYLYKAEKWYKEKYGININDPIGYDEDGNPVNITDEEADEIENIYLEEGTDTSDENYEDEED